MEAKNTLNKIAVLLGLTDAKESEAHTVYMTEARLEDGTLIATDAEAWEPGVEVFIVPDEGDRMPLPVGEYSLDGGSVMVVVEEGIVAEVLPADEIKDEEEVTKEVSAEEMTEEEEETTEELAEIGDWEGMEKRIQNLEDAVADLKADKQDKDEVVIEEEMSQTEVLDAIRDFVETLSKEHKEIVTAKDSVIDVMTENLATAQNEAEEAEAKLISFAAAPATEAIKHTPNPSAYNEEKVDLGKMSTAERVAHIMKNNK